ncbi:MAG: NAD-dependent epimerase/dehydratase family protein [Imperialibacter sp.]|uniref:NAD-dependent epimerase/dehydratase family protein n=1 Tax=Imperialibacter sp. TaxID=2038411 RepID=UPI0030DD93FE|tara:strand:- start:6393 stop:7457 length:1065 start_codon:yes stop_codon:yes gene_type:complete
MKIVVTGGAGFVGSNLAIFLNEKISNCEIVCMDNLKRRGSELNIPVLKSSGIEFIHGDIRNPEDLSTIESADFIIDASAEASVLAGIQSPVYPLINTNFNGTIHLLELAKKLNSRFIFLSTSRVYPVQALNNINWKEESTRFSIEEKQSIGGVSAKGISEEFPLKGSRSFYGSSKLASELFIEEYTAYGGLKAIVNRCGVIAGPGQMGKVDQGVLTLWVARHFWKKELSYIGFSGSGKQVRDILHIDDLKELILRQIVNFEKCSGQLFNIGGGKENSISLAELTSICQSVTGNKTVIAKIEENREADIRTYITDNSRISDRLDWNPAKSVQATVEDIFSWLAANESTLKPILGQ